MSKTKILAIIFSVVFLLTFNACGGGQNSNDEQGDQNAKSEDSESKDGENKTNEEEGTGQSGVPVKVAVIERGAISSGIMSTSVVEAEQMVEVFSRVTGIVTKIAAEEGSMVRGGQLLCALEDEELSLQESKTRAEMEKLKSDLDRTNKLLEKGIATETDQSNAKYSYEQAEISWRQAKTNLEYTQINSTINGIVSERIVKLGQKVEPSMKLYTLFNPRSLVVNVHIPESDYFSRIANRTEKVSAIIFSESLPGVEFTGSIKRVAPVVDPETNTIKVTLNYVDPENILRPGMYVRVRLITDTRETAVLIPKTAVMFDENKQFVFVIKDEKAEKVTLKPGYEDTNYIEALSDIEAGDQVVTVGQNGLKEGTKVRIVTDRPIRAESEKEETEE